MRINLKKTKYGTYLYILDSQRINGKIHTRIVQKCGKLSELSKIYDDPIEHFKQEALKLTLAEDKDITVKFRREYRPTNETKTSTVKVGHFFLRKIYRSLKLDYWCREISKKENYSFNLSEIFSSLIYGSYLFPGSKLSVFEQLKQLIDSPKFQIHQLYRALEVINKHINDLQAHIYKNSENVCKRNIDLLYYDCTNYYFEIDKEDIKETIDENGEKKITKGLRARGHEKNQRKDPIVQLGLLLDGNGIPLAFYVFNGNLNEQATLKELEERIISDFGHSEFTICTDAGLGSFDNKVFNSLNNRKYVISQPVKSLKGETEKWAQNPKGWRYFVYNTKTRRYDISDPVNLDELSEEQKQLHHKTVFFKDEKFDKKGNFKSEDTLKKMTLNIRYVVTFSFEKQEKQAQYRQYFVDKAKEVISKKAKINKSAPNDIKRYISNIHYTSEGEVASECSMIFNDKQLEQDKKWDGYYCVSTNLELNIKRVLRIHYGRWEIEENFKHMRQDFKARPVYLSREDRIKAHFAIQFVVLLFARIIEQKVNETGFNTFNEILDAIRGMDLAKLQNQGYTPLFEQTDLTKKIQKIFGIDFYYEGLSEYDIKAIEEASKKVF